LFYRKIGVLDSFNHHDVGFTFVTAIANGAILSHVAILIAGLLRASPHVLLRLELAEEPQLGALLIRQAAHAVQIAAQLAPLRNVTVGQLETALHTLQRRGIFAQHVQIGGAHVVELRVVLQCRASLVQLGESGAQEGDALWRLGEKVELGAGVEAGRQLVGLKLLVILPNKTVNSVYWRCLLRLFLASINFITVAWTLDLEEPKINISKEIVVRIKFNKKSVTLRLSVTVKT
jgi:hypothetical protein